MGFSPIGFGGSTFSAICHHGLANATSNLLKVLQSFGFYPAEAD